MQTTVSSYESRLLRMKDKLVPNFQLLDHAVQKQIVRVLELMHSNPTKKQLQQFSRLSTLEEAPMLRSHLWKLLLQTLSLDATTWDATIQANKELYSQLVDKFIGTYIDEEDLLGMGAPIIDLNLWSQIELDTKRTHSVLNFFQKEVDHTKMYLSRKTRNSDIMGRILYIWGKINPTVKYVQGMNQILAPLYYLEFQSQTPYSQSECFFMFAALMSFVMDMHIKDMDQSDVGIMGKMNSLNKYLKVVDYELWARLQHQKIIPHYYSFRWLALLLAQQFGLYQTMRLWDVLLSYDGYKRYFFLYSLCIGILKIRKPVIMHSDFMTILPSIQKLREMDVGKVVQIGSRLYEKYSRVNVEMLWKKINEELQNRGEAGKQQQAKQRKWTEGMQGMLKSTGNFIAKFVGNMRPK